MDDCWKSVGLSLDEKKLQVTLRANPNLQLHLCWVIKNCFRILIHSASSAPTISSFHAYFHFSFPFINWLVTTAADPISWPVCVHSKNSFTSHKPFPRKQCFLPFKWKQARRQVPLFYSVLQLISSDTAVNMGWVCCFMDPRSEHPAG
ncbi:hypothetical protein T01_11135 [Trichinella spiralis]|uniref:Uncharacterized protein n=1 Tax=Trichinella spiralis TaxID=6334 RepID=A0A0V1BEW6_TRISP|nr:hypothetical protein T01_11135 [Trichinella spiralis]